ncbi:hypothetical protein M9Y10_043044 [Tritrichomonas musculus]|uniref:Protein kinase domain-containing protein n=1 Tax=Tritrichomonas musculus TaxID=1915356 RepID=A0ABR2JYK7_9EUKA
MEAINILPDRLLNDLEDFEIDDTVINRGGYGIIYSGSIKSTKQKIAAKKSIKNDLLSVKSIIQEYNMLVQCNHPLIQMPIGLYISENSDECVLITPFYERGSLSNFIQSQNGHKLDETQIFIIAIGIAAAMKYLHKIDISHRDIKPNNILINDFNYPILIDFGLSRNNIEQMTTEAGTLIYTAPEVFSNSYDKSIDVYSYGLIINEMYTGCPPFLDTSLNKMIKIKTEGTFELDQSMPKYLHKIVRQCLSPNPQERPTFREILIQLRSKLYSIQSSAIASSLLKYIKLGKKQKRFFRIPKQILKIPSKTFKYDFTTEDPIDWNNLEKIFISNDDTRNILIMTIGNHEIGKSTFLRTITGNQAFHSGKGMESTTVGLLLDGPYSFDDIKKQIFDMDYQRKFDEINIDNDIQIYFIDSQGIGEEEYKKNSLVLDRINSIFCSISTVCITIERSNVSDQSLQNVFKIIRRVQFYGPTNEYLLVREYQDFDSLTNLSYASLNQYQQTFKEKFRKTKREVSEYYVFDFLTPIPIGNLTSNYDSYFRSLWYSFHKIFSDINKDTLHTKDEITDLLKINISQIFGNRFSDCYQGIIQSPCECVSSIMPNSDKNTSDIIKLCYSAFYFLANEIISILECSQLFKSNLSELKECINYSVFSVARIILPYFIGEYNCSIHDFNQYEYELGNDMNSFLKKNSAFWYRHMKEENNATKACIPVYVVGTVLSCLSYVPIVGIPFGFVGVGINGSFLLYKKIQKRIRNNILKSFRISIFPFLWDRDPIKFKSNSLDMSIITQIGYKNDQLIVFFEQDEQNDSTLIFNSLTGFNVKFQGKEKISELFRNVPIKKFMQRYKRNGKVHTSNLQNVTVNILYLKGYGQDYITTLCHTQKVNPIFVSSMKSKQILKISPDEDYIFNLFYIDKELYKYDIVNKRLYLDQINNSNEYISKIQKIKNKNLYVLPISSKDYDFNNNGPFAHAMIKYGCRFILQDISLFPLNKT